MFLLEWVLVIPAAITLIIVMLSLFARWGDQAVEARMRRHHEEGRESIRRDGGSV